jgi:protein-tyrosine phosphatase
MIERPDEPFRVLFVCTANICRSPIAEQLMRHDLEIRLGKPSAEGWVVESAGTHAIVGAPIHESARRALAERGVVAPETSARQVLPEDIQSSHLILTSTRTQRTAVATALPSAVRRVFTLRQFARLCAAGRRETGVEHTLSGHELLELAAIGRTRVQPVSATEDAIADPIGKDRDAFRACAALTAMCLEAILSPLPVAS